MKRIAVFAILAIVAAMVPMTTASSQPTPGSLDGVGTLMVINAHTTPLDLWIEIESGEWIEIELSSTDQEEVQVPDGTRNFVLCLQGSTSELCAGSAPFGTGGSVEVDENDIINFLITANPGVTGTDFVLALDNDTEATETDSAKLTLVNGIGIPLAFCVDEELVVSSPGGGTLTTGEFDSNDGEEQLLEIYVGVVPADCSVVPTSSRELGFPSGSNTVINLTINASCTSDCGYQIFPGEEPPGSDQLVDEFCAVVLEAANITTWLQDLFAEVEVGNPDTYPDAEEVEEVITRIAELLELGNETAPDDIIDAWLTATAAFVETGRLAAVQYELEALPQDDLRRLVSGIDQPPADDEEEAAATAALSAWVPANCFGETTIEPDFTG